MAKPFRLRTILPGVAFCTTITGLVAGQQRPRRESRQLPDGSTLTLEGVTFGPGEHAFVAGNRLQRLLAGTLSPEFVRRMGIRTGVSDVPQPVDAEDPTGESLVCWFSWSPPPQTIQAMPWQLYVKSAEGGFTYGDPNENQEAPRREPGNHLIPVRLRSFPRRSSQLTLGVFSGTEMDPALRLGATYSVRNPAVRNYPEWPAERLPATRTVEGLPVTLRSVTRVTNAATNEPDRPAFHYADIILQIGDNPRNRKEWRPAEVVLSDATGNRLRTFWRSDSFTEGSPGLWEAQVGFELPADSVWKVAVRLVHVKDWPVAARFSRLALPPKGRIQNITRMEPIEGGNIVVDEISPPEMVLRTSGMDGSKTRLLNYEVQFRALGIPDGEKLELTSTGDGDMLTHLDVASGHGRFDISTTPGWRSVDITFERDFQKIPVPPGRTVESTVRPRIE